MGAVGARPGRPQHFHLVHAGLLEDDGALGVTALQQGGRAFARQQRRHHRGVDDPPHERIIAVHLHADVTSRRSEGDLLQRDIGFCQFGSRPQRGEQPLRIRQIAGSARPGSRRRRKPPKFQVAQTRLIPLSKQLEDAHALAEVVVGVGGPSLGRADAAAEAEELAPGAAHPPGLNARAHRFEPLLAFAAGAERQQRFDGDQLTQNRVSGRNALHRRDVVGHAEGGALLSATQRQPRFEHAQPPVIPARGLRAVLAVGLLGPLNGPPRIVQLAANQMNLGERVENGARGLPHEPHRASHVEGAVQGFLRPAEISDPDANLPQRGQRDPEPVRRSGFLLELDAALGQRQRILVPVLHRSDVGLVAADGGQHVPGLGRRGEALGMPHRHQRLLEPSLLREGDARK
jgi:hypothetical protein